MNKLITAVILLTISLSSYSSEEPEERLVFIGSQINFNEFDPNEESDGCDDVVVDTSNGEEGLMECITISLDAAFKATYSISKVVEGSYLGDSISFEVYDHYGTPEFSKYDVAMIYLEKYDGKWYHEKYTWNKVYETVDGQYADCSLDYVNEHLYEPGLLKPVKFKKVVNFDIRHYNSTLKNSFKSAPAFLSKGNLVTCQKGIYAKDLLALERG
ncbi:hypothetical protein [Microbulbifer aggregans]|uniref:hypothetical protein n=1 Tax=Microbulbifer aggregans TaxID=1769779 RepID=UPI001CFD9D48|nr:hypothetical protein [Microbulbifer aggregans]